MSRDRDRRERWDRELAGNHIVLGHESDVPVVSAYYANLTDDQVDAVLAGEPMPRRSMQYGRTGGSPNVAARRCGLCGQKGHNRRICGRDL